MRFASPLTLVALLAAPAAAQNVLETPKAVIEVLGLRRWTVAMIEDSLRKYEPKSSLTGHSCAAVLRYKLGFADAAVKIFVGARRDDPRQYVTITVIEPTDSALIRYRPEFRDSARTRAEWADAFKAFRTESEVAQRSLQTPGFYDPTSPDTAQFAPVAALRRVLLSSRDEASRQLAMRTLERDGNMENRVIAAIILANFMDRDESWWMLTDALRDPTGIVSGTASQVLATVTRTRSRAVDWKPVVGQLRSILDGTNLFAFDQLARTLAATRVDPALAPALIGGNGAVPLAKLRSQNDFTREPSAQLLAQLSGKPITSSADEMEAWVRRLPSR